MPLIYNKALNLTETEIRYAMSNSKSNAGAARFIGCHVTTYKRYAKRYIDTETGLSLWDLHTNQSGKGIHRNFTGGHFKSANIFDILEGKHPGYDRDKLASRLIEEVILKEECNNCGFDERRITDYKVPLILTWKDGNLRNHALDNLEFICYNCYFLTLDDVFQKTSRVNFKGF
tara:strand:+ start:615 stop:1136 length:522 start_codon:yes stop_codon:yes gene_type:complete